MAGTITLTTEMKCDTPSIGIARLTQQLAMAGSKYTSLVASIGFAAHELIVLAADQTTVGMCAFKNTDPTNYVEIGIDASAAFKPLIKLLPGEIAIFRSTTNAIYAKANTGAVELQCLIFEP